MIFREVATPIPWEKPWQMKVFLRFPNDSGGDCYWVSRGGSKMYG